MTYFILNSILQSCFRNASCGAALVCKLQILIVHVCDAVSLLVRERLISCIFNFLLVDLRYEWPVQACFQGDQLFPSCGGTRALFLTRLVKGLCCLFACHSVC